MKTKSFILSDGIYEPAGFGTPGSVSPSETNFSSIMSDFKQLCY